MHKISLQMYTLREYTKTLDGLKNTVERLGEIGFRTLQYSIPAHYDVREVKRIFDANGMVNDSVYCPCLQLEEKMRDILDQCELFETRYVRTNSIPDGLNATPAGYKMFAHYLNEAGVGLKREGKILLYHFHAFEFIRFGAERGIDILLRESDPELVQIIPDTHWIQSGGDSVVGFLERYRDRYDYVHCKDFGITRRGAEKVEYRPIVYAPVGEGNLPWGDILALCKNKGVVSYAIEQDDCYGRDPFDCVASSFNFLRGMGVDD